jgi:hypothetical protein
MGYPEQAAAEVEQVEQIGQDGQFCAYIPAIAQQ